MNNVWIPGASAAQRFDGRFPCYLVNPNKGVLHSTETGTWPGYDGGANAPNATLLWDGRTLNVRDHFPLNMPARALRNFSGGVDTNTAGVAQFEIVGTCDRPTAARYGYLYLPEAGPAFYAALAGFMRTVESLTAIPRASTARPWLAYPSSYGNSPARMSFAEWNGFRGWCGHQHVPENDHGDPGNLDIARLLSNGDTNDMADITEAQMSAIAAHVWGKTVVREGGIGPAPAEAWLTHAAYAATEAATRTRNLEAGLQGLQATVTGLAATGSSVSKADVLRVLTEQVQAALSGRTAVLAPVLPTA